MESLRLNSDSLLRNQIYNYLREQLQYSYIKPGSVVAIKNLIGQINASRTPIREALLQLQSEGFVTIMPQRGVIVNELRLEDVQNIYEIVGALESRVLISVFDKIGKAEIATLEGLNAKMKACISDVTEDGTIHYYDLNLRFHDVFLSLSENKDLVSYVNTKKRRLYDFTKINYGRKWKETNFREHQTLIKLLEEGDAIGAANFMRDQHWVFKFPELFTG